MNAVITSLKTGKAAGEDDIRPEMLKAMNVYGVRWLTRVCKQGRIQGGCVGSIPTTSHSQTCF